MTNTISMDTLCAALCKVMGIDPPAEAQAANETLTAYVEKALGGACADRIFMYNPDAIAEWIYRKYASLCDIAKERTELELPLCTVMPSVTPVCFGTMYTGAQPAVHGIRKYEKPVITIDTIFDALLRAGKKPVILSTEKASLSKIFLSREMDYFIYETIEEVNAKASELILAGAHDFIVVYNGNYDSAMHRYGTESPEALAELRANVRAFGTFNALIRAHWGKHNTLVGFAMDHGCHDIDGGCGSHGLDMPEDLNIIHFYGVYPKK